MLKSSNISTETKMTEELLTYLKGKLALDIVELAKIDKQTSEELAALPVLEDSKDIKVVVKNAKIKPKIDLINNKLDMAKLAVVNDNRKINNCKLTLELMGNNEQFKALNFVSHHFQLIEDDINTLEITPAIIIDEPKTALIFRDVFSRQSIRVYTCLDYSFSIYDYKDNIINLEEIPNYKEFRKFKKSEIISRVESYNVFSNNKLSEKEFLNKAKIELKELIDLKKDEYDEIFNNLYSDFEQVRNIKNMYC